MVNNPKSLPSKLLDAVAHVSYWPRTLQLIWAAAPRWTTAWAILLVVQGVLPAASVYLTKLLVDSLVAAINARGAWGQVRPALILIILTAAVMLLVEFLQSAIEWVRTAQSELIQDHIKCLIHQQSAAVDLAFYESPEFHDKLDQARNEASTRPLVILENVGSLVQNGITLLAMAAVLVPYSAWLPLILFVSTLPAFYVMLRFDRRYHHWWQRMTANRRWTQYYDVMLTHSGSAAELRLFGLSPYFQSTYQTLRRRLRAERLGQMKKQSFAKLGATTLAFLVSGITIVWMVWRALHGLASLGDLALFYQAFNRGQGLMRSLLGSVSQILTSNLYLGNLFAFLDLTPRVIDPQQPTPPPVNLKEGINFRDITFRYPGSERVALKDFNLCVPAGKIVAIVGPNGAGKTTLLKLLCRFYDPERGRIEVDGIDIRQLSIKELRRLTTVLFQFPLNYHATAGQSIALGDLPSAPGTAEIEAAARSAGAHAFIERLPEGYDTLLGRVLADGVELSGGEQQRIAMARAYLRQSPIIVLDEPTSFLDSWTEADWFERFRTLAQERTAIVITHRFSIAMRADTIHVMHDGEIVESGSHHALLAQGGLYAQSWSAQMRASSNDVNRSIANDDSLDGSLILEGVQ
jgi:ATP-binding cassette subfamily B protein